MTTLSYKINPIKSIMIRLVFFHLLIITGMTLIMLCIKGVPGGRSFFAGALSCWLPSALFVWSLSRFSGAHAAYSFLMTFFVGEVIKLILSATLFITFMKYLHLELLLSILGLITAVVAFWLASLVSLMRSGVKI